MSINTLRTICDGLNAEPFSQNLTPVKLDSQTPEKLLQNLSDVVQWIQGQPFIDVRAENPDETAIRILNALRIFRYPPARDIDQIQKWRFDILEGQKSTVYTILQWIFENVDRLKERVYLAKYLTRIEVPPDAQSPEVARLEATVVEKMEEFKLIHAQIVESRGDYLRAEDVCADLKAMEEEKEQLQRKIERSRRRLVQVPDLEKHLEVAGRLYAETERLEELQLRRQEQHDALLHADKRLTRLEKALADAERERDLDDPESVITKLKSEVEVSGYLLNEKLMSDIAAQKANIETIQKVLSMRSVDKTDIAQLQEKVEQLNAEISNIQTKQDKDEENGDDKLAIYRHQAANVQRKKANVANTLQNTQQELDSIEAIIATKREEIMKKSGKDEIVSSVQYKAYMKKLRSKGTHYKRKKNELEHAKMELQILERTVELLSRRITQLQKQCEKEGRNFIQNSDNQRRGVTAERPKTAKPSTTNVTELKEIIKQLNEQLNEKRARVQRISSSIDEFYQAHKDENEEYYAKQREIDAFKNRLENDYKQLKAEISDLEATIKTKQNDLDTNKENVAKLEWFLEKLSSANEVDAVFQELEQQSVEYMKDINELTAEIEKLEQDENATNQLAMWKSLTKIFRLKINLHQQRNDNDKPIGDNIIY